MAVVRANYVKRGEGERPGAKANIQYIQQRTDRDKEKQTRILFDNSGILGRIEAFQMIDDAPKGSLFYRLKLSPDPKTEDTKLDLDMQTLTRNTMQSLSDRLNIDIPWVAALHDDHSDVRHIHLLAVISQKLNRQDLTFLIQESTRISLEQRRGLDIGQSVHHSGGRQTTNQLPNATTRPHNRPSVRQDTDQSQPTYSVNRGVPRATRPVTPVPTCTCYRCHFHQTHKKQAGIHRCVSCGVTLHQKQLRLDRKELGRRR